MPWLYPWDQITQSTKDLRSCVQMCFSNILCTFCHIFLIGSVLRIIYRFSSTYLPIGLATCFIWPVYSLFPPGNDVFHSNTEKCVFHCSSKCITNIYF